MSTQDLRAKFPNAEVIEMNQLLRTEDVDKGPWKIYIFREDGYHEGGQWFRVGKAKYPAEEISFARAKQFCESAVGKGLEVRICNAMDWLVFHSVRGKVVHGGTFWNEANPDPAAVAVADRLKRKAVK